MDKPKVLFIDNFDSFSYMLVDYLKQQDLMVEVVRNDYNLEKLKDKNFKGLVVSPGPGTPNEAGISLAAIDFWANQLPILGVCLGHQAIGVWQGVKLIKALKPIHGKIDQVQLLDNDLLFEGINQEFSITRYHSLILEKELSQSLKVLGVSKSDGAVMALKHKSLPIWGVQYHPEALGTEFGLRTIENWANYVRFSQIH